MNGCSTELTGHQSAVGYPFDTYTTGNDKYFWISEERLNLFWIA